MAAPTNKQQLLDKTLTLLQTTFHPPAEPDKRPVLEEVVFAMCRESLPTATADAAFARLRRAFVDWTEIRLQGSDALAARAATRLASTTSPRAKNNIENSNNPKSTSIRMGSVITNSMV